ncbi:MAG: DUF4031 domain-containing protein [Micropruina sp.]|uniref:DUF4031 domain-containing protein n=1 Tax=Micropruina sp. TaxID=2737536 RepID=UPI0039E68A01
MAILLDPPRWPAHGTDFGHLVSDASLDELHAFAQAAGIPCRAFDHDHYDVPVARYPDLIDAGAIQVSSGELLRRLVDAGLRVRPRDRTPKRPAALASAQESWRGLLPQAPELGEELLQRWSEPHRRYHDVRHLAQCLAALQQLAIEEPIGRPVLLAAWFHDAVYNGEPHDDEEASAALADERLRPLVGAAEAAEAARLVRATIAHDPEPDDRDAALLVDADLSILGQLRGRYHVYLRDVREEYSRYDDQQFQRGRLTVVQGLLSRRPLFATATGRRLWGAAAELNLTEERDRLLGREPPTAPGSDPRNRDATVRLS